MPDYNLGINNTSHEAMTGRMLEKIEKILIKEKPDCVLVYGDTNSTLAGALAAVKLNIPVAPMEAGLRSYDITNPFPEEGLRQMISMITRIHFTQTPLAAKRLLRQLDHNHYTTYNEEI